MSVVTYISVEEEGSDREISRLSSPGKKVSQQRISCGLTSTRADGPFCRAEPSLGTCYGKLKCLSGEFCCQCSNIWTMLVRTYRLKRFSLFYILAVSLAQARPGGLLSMSVYLCAYMFTTLEPRDDMPFPDNNLGFHC